MSHPFKKKKTIAFDFSIVPFVAATPQCKKIGMVLNQVLELRIVLIHAFTELTENLEREINTNTSLRVSRTLTERMTKRRNFKSRG